MPIFDKDFPTWLAEGYKYFKKLSEGRNPTWEKMEEAIDDPSLQPPPPSPHKGKSTGKNRDVPRQRFYKDDETTKRRKH